MPIGSSNSLGRAFTGSSLGAVVSTAPNSYLENTPVYKQTLNYYLNLFTSQYKTAPRLQAFQAILLQPLDDLTTCIVSMNSKFDLDSAIGVQLDAIGKILQCARTVLFQPSGGVSPTLDDDTYRILLYATLARYLWDGKTSSLYPIWQVLFPNGVLIINDNQNMTCTILIRGTFSSIEQDLITNGYIVPRPEGVLYNYTIGSSIWFGFDLDNAVIAGFDTGHFA